MSQRGQYGTRQRKTKGGTEADLEILKIETVNSKQLR